MSRRLLFFAFLFCTYHLSDAQLLVGPVVQGEVSKLFFFDSQFRYKSQPALGYGAGLMASMRVRKNFVLNAQILYSQRGKHIVGTNDVRSDANYDLTARMNYIDMPLSYVVEFKRLTGDPTGQGGRVKTYSWFVGGGPIISYWLSGHGVIRSSNLSENNIDHISFTNVFGKANTSLDDVKNAGVENLPDANRWQFGLNFVGGVAFEPVGLHRIVASVNLDIAQTFLGKTAGYFPGSPSHLDIDVVKAKNHSLRFSLSYLIDTKIDKARKGKSTSKETRRRR